MSGTAADLDALVGRLVERGVLESADGVTTVVLSGGVSADVVVVRGARRSVVAKRALPHLRVAQDWSSSPERVIVEAAALEWAHRVRPHNVPAVIDLDEERLVLTLECAPEGASNWKRALLAGSIEPAIGRSLGEALADWHTKSAHDPVVLERFARHNHFFDLRIAPFFLATAKVHAELADAIHDVVARMEARRICLVHGDFSPKNVLFGPDWHWVLDWETAHCGDPTFDLAFLLSHLLCKAVHRPVDAARYRVCADAFLSAYAEHSPLAIDRGELGRQIGCLLLARVDGKSPVDYLDSEARARVRTIGRRAVTLGSLEVGVLWPTAGGGGLSRR